MENKVQKDKRIENEEEKIHRGKESNKWVQYQKEMRKIIGHKQYMKSYRLKIFQNSLRRDTTNSRGTINPNMNKLKGINI